MRILYFIIFILCQYGCDNVRKVDSDNVKSSSPPYISPYDDILNKENYIRGRDTLHAYLKDHAYDVTIYYDYQLLTHAHIYLLEFDQADSLLKLIDPTELDASQELAYFNNMIEIRMQYGEYSDALTFINKKWDHPGALFPSDIRETLFYFEKWKIFSLMKQCDSSRAYLDNYLISVKKNPKMMEYHWLDEEKLSYYNRQLKSDCPLIDSVGMSTPIVTAIKYE